MIDVFKINANRLANHKLQRLPHCVAGLKHLTSCEEFPDVVDGDEVPGLNPPVAGDGGRQDLDPETVLGHDVLWGLEIKLRSKYEGVIHGQRRQKVWDWRHDPVSLYQFAEWGLTTNEVLRPGQTRQGGKQHQETCPDPEEKLEMTK